jgi:hypothetical protein
MTVLQKLYRKDITTETVNLVGLLYEDRWRYQTEDITIPQFKNLSDRAVVVGNGVTANEFDLTKILPYRESTPWGETTPWIYKRQRRNFFTYGCNAIYRNYKLDFVSCTGEGIVKEIAESTRDKTGTLFYANSKYLEKYPGEFNFLPQNPDFNSGAMSAYMAAFDGHKRVYLLGFDGIDTPTNNYNIFAGTANYPQLNHPISEDYWVRSLKTIMNVYTDTEFIRVCPTKKFRASESWKDSLNYRQIDFRQFVLEADI